MITVYYSAPTGFIITSYRDSWSSGRTKFKSGYTIISCFRFWGDGERCRVRVGEWGEWECEWRWDTERCWDWYGDADEWEGWDGVVGLCCLSTTGKFCVERLRERRGLTCV